MWIMVLISPMFLANLERSRHLHNNRNFLRIRLLHTLYSMAFLLVGMCLEHTSSNQYNKIFQQFLRIPCSSYTTNIIQVCTGTFETYNLNIMKKSKSINI